IPPPMNPGEPDRRLWAAQAGVAGTLGVPDAALVERLGPAESALARAWASLLRWRAAAGDRARELLLGQAAAPPEPRALLGALLLGEEEPDLREVRSAFTRLGLAH